MKYPNTGSVIQVMDIGLSKNGQTNKPAVALHGSLGIGRDRRDGKLLPASLCLLLFSSMFGILRSAKRKPHDSRLFSANRQSKLKEAGCHTVYLGIESGVQEMLNRIKKGITLEQVKDSVRAVNNAGLNAVGSFILGIPGETREQMKRTVEFAKDLGLTLAQFSLLTPYPGTKEFGKRMERKEEISRCDLESLPYQAYLKEKTAPKPNTETGSEDRI